VRAALVRHSIDVPALIREVASAAHGATAIFVGTVRDVSEGRAVTGIEYSAYESMAEREMAAIVTEAMEKYGSAEVVVEHRVGYLEIGEASIAIVAAHERRGPAIDAMRYAIEEIKCRVPIWKQEHYADGTREWVNPTRGHAA